MQIAAANTIVCDQVAMMILEFRSNQLAMVSLNSRFTGPTGR